MDNLRKSFGRHIKQLRQMRDMTQEQLAELADISISFIGGIERGLKSPTIETLQKLANALDIPLNRLMTFESALKTETDARSSQVRELLDEYTEKIIRLYEK